MSDSRPDEPVASPAAYWTCPRILFGVLMAVTALGVVAFVQRDELARIFRPDDPGRSAHAAFQPVSGGDTFDLGNLQLDRAQLIFGGPPKDGIPSITDPGTVPVADADFMRPDDRVVGVTVNGESRAYPIKVLNWHECYNDTLGGVPIAVVFCPLCDSVTVVDRRLNGKTHEFGISGLLVNSNVLLYDRQDDALWSQAGLIAVSGPNAGRSLIHLSGWEVTTFARWREAHPGSTVATLDTGYYSVDRYNATAYESYFQTDDVMFPVSGMDNRFPNKHPVVGVRFGETAKAYPVAAIHDAPRGRIEDTINGMPVVLESTGGPGTVRIVDVPGGARVIHTFWFAWYAFHPGTAVYTPPGG